MQTLDGNPGPFGVARLAHPSVEGSVMFREGGGLDQAPGSTFSTLPKVEKEFRSFVQCLQVDETK